MREKGEGGERMELERIRAWLFIHTEEVREAIKRIKELLTEGGEQYVVVRADHVKSSRKFPFNLVIPIDAQDEEVLEEIVEQLVKMSGAERHVVAMVRHHTPYPPQAAHCFLTDQETEGDSDWPEGGGRYPKSPGRNPWG